MLSPVQFKDTFQVKVDSFLISLIVIKYTDSQAFSFLVLSLRRRGIWCKFCDTPLHFLDTRVIIYNTGMIIAWSSPWESKSHQENHPTAGHSCCHSMILGAKRVESGQVERPGPAKSFHSSILTTTEGKGFAWIQWEQFEFVALTNLHLNLHLMIY